MSTETLTALEEYCAAVLQESKIAEAESVTDRVSLLWCDREHVSELLTGALDAPSDAANTLMLALLQRARWYLHQLNQFVVPSASDVEKVHACMTRWLSELGEGLSATRSADECAATLVAVNRDLLEGLTAVMAPYAEPTRPKVLSEQYSIETQLDVLHLSPEALEQPVLDIGCGRDAWLVLWLRERQVNAMGVDAFAPKIPGCIQADWQKFPFLPEHFGTITAHLSFSLHFLHQHLRPEGEARAYAVTYMAILRSLRRGGCFAYAPGLPFIERLLPADQYKIEIYPIRELPLDPQASEFFERSLGESPIYTAHIVRR